MNENSYNHTLKKSAEIWLNWLNKYNKKKFEIDSISFEKLVCVLKRINFEESNSEVDNTNLNLCIESFLSGISLELTMEIIAVFCSITGLTSHAILEKIKKNQLGFLTSIQSKIYHLDSHCFYLSGKSFVVVPLKQLESLGFKLCKKCENKRNSK